MAEWILKNGLAVPSADAALYLPLVLFIITILRADPVKPSSILLVVHAWDRF
jgi:hypothetical protein